MSALRDPKRQALIFFILVTLVYAFAARPVERVTDFVKLGNYVYLTAGPVGLRILDVGGPGVKPVGAFLTEDDAQAVEVRSFPHNGVTRMVAYVADGDKGVAVIDVTDPARPLSLQQVGGDTLSDLTLWKEYLYGAAGEKGVVIYKINPDGKLEKVKDTHFTGNIERLSVGQDRLFVIDDETLRVRELGPDPLLPPEVGTYNVNDRVNDIQVINGTTGQQVYLAADRSGAIGLSVSQAITITSPATISVTQKIDTAGRATGVFRFDQTLLIADGKKGVRVYDLTPNKPSEIGFYETWGLTTRVLADPQTSHVYVGDGYSGLRRLEFLQKMKLTKDGAILDSRAGGITYAAPYLFVANGGQGLRVLVRGASGAWEEVAFYDTFGNAQAVQVRPKDGIALVADGQQLSVVQLKDLYNVRNQAQREYPQLDLLGFLKTELDADLQDIRLAPDRSVAYLAAGKAGLLVIDTRIPRQMAVLGREQAGDAHRLELARQVAFVAAGEQGVQIVSVHDDRFPTRLMTVDLQAPAMGVAVLDGGPNQPVYVYVAAGQAGLCVFPALSAAHADNPHCLAAGQAQDVSVDPATRRAYVVNSDGLMIPFSLDDPLHPRPLEPTHLGQPLNRVTFAGTQVIAAAGVNGLRWVDLADRNRSVGVFDFAQRILQFDKRDQLIYAATGPQGASQGNNQGLRILDAKSSYQEIGRYRSTPAAIGGVAYAATVHPSGNPAYLADGTNGLRVIDVSNPRQPRLVQTVLSQLDVRYLWIDRHNPKRGYLALGSGDLALVDLTTPLSPGVLASAPACSPSPAVWVQSYQGHYAFVACQGTGIASIQLTEDGHLQRVARYEAAPFISNLTIMDPQDAKQMPAALLDPSFKDAYLLAAAGKDGLLVLNISRPERLEPQPNQPLQDGPVSSVYSRDTYAFVSNAAGDINVYSMIAPAHPVKVSSLTAPDPAHPLGTTALYAENLAVNKGEAPIGYQIYAASTAAGFSWNKAVKEPKLTQVGLYETPGTASGWEVFGTVANEVNAGLKSLAGDFKQLGLGWVASKLNEMRSSLGERVKSLSKMLGTPWPETGVSPKALATLSRIFLGDFLLLGLGGLCLWVAILGQFALPVNGGSQRLQAASRLMAYLFGGHGTMTRIHDGQISRPDDDAAHHGPGVVLVDVTSAAVLEKRILHRPLPLQALSKLFLQPTPSAKAPYGLEHGEPRPPERVVGPGLYFTGGNPGLSNPKWDEVVLQAVDLRNQARTTADEVFALTQEGIEVKNRVFCQFTLGQPPEVLMVTYLDGVPQAEALRVVRLEGHLKSNGTMRRYVKVTALADELDPADKLEIHQQVQAWRRDGQRMEPYSEAAVREYSSTNGQPFIVDPQRIFAAAVSRADHGGQEKQLEWHELPERTAVKFYRDLLAQQPYDALYRPADPVSYPLKFMKADLARMVRNQGVLAYQYIESEHENAPLAQDQDVLENTLRVYPIRQLVNVKDKVLRSRGIRVLLAGFTPLIPVSSGVQARLTENWRSRWEKHADRVRTDYQIQAMRIRTHARAEAQLDMLKSLQIIFDAGGQSQEALALRVFQALEVAAADPLTRQLLPNETISMIQVLHNWLMTENERPKPSGESGTSANPPKPPTPPTGGPP